MRLEGWHLIIIIILVLVLFAAPRLPGMARSLGQSMRILKSEVREMKQDDPPVKGPAAHAGEGEAVNRPKSTGAGSSAVGGSEAPPPTSV